MTIKEVAELAGVSNAAVSRYLNGGYLAEEKRERVRRAIEQTGYAPSAQARALRTGSSRIVGVIVPKINSESVSRITAGVGQVLRERGYQMLLANTSNHAERELEYLELFQSHPVDGIIIAATVITPAHRAFLKKAKVPVVLVGQKVRGYNCVYHDDQDAASELACHIVERLRATRGLNRLPRIAYVGVTQEDKAAGKGRFDGFVSGLASCGVSFDENLYREVEFSLEAGYEAASSLLDAPSDNAIDFISCATDTIAAGAIEAITERFESMRAAGAPGVSGFGDNGFLRAVTGGIPTVHFGYLTSGVKAAQMLMGIIDGETSVAMQVELGYQLKGLEL